MVYPCVSKLLYDSTLQASQQVIKQKDKYCFKVKLVCQYAFASVCVCVNVVCKRVMKAKQGFWIDTYSLHVTIQFLLLFIHNFCFCLVDDSNKTFLFNLNLNLNLSLNLYPNLSSFTLIFVSQSLSICFSLFPPSLLYFRMSMRSLFNPYDCSFLSIFHFFFLFSRLNDKSDLFGEQSQIFRNLF